jgi:hypothetical protein
MTYFRLTSSALLLTLFLVNSSSGADYGVDCSWPIHSTELKCGDLIGDRKSNKSHHFALLHFAMDWRLLTIVVSQFGVQE